MTAVTLFNLLLLACLIVLVFYHFIYQNVLQLLAIHRIKKNGHKALATIIETKKTRGKDGATFVHTVFKYTTKSGQIITTHIKYAKGTRPQIGKELTLYYLPSTPDKFYVPNPLSYEIVPIMLATPGLIFCLTELLEIASRL
jgi:hypothetical protein